MIQDVVWGFSIVLMGRSPRWETSCAKQPPSRSGGVRAQRPGFQGASAVRISEQITVRRVLIAVVGWNHFEMGS